MTEQEWISYTEDICYITGKIMSKDDKARFTYEFDAWVSEEGRHPIQGPSRWSWTWLLSYLRRVAQVVDSKK